MDNIDSRQYVRINNNGVKSLEFTDSDLDELPENLPDDAEILHCARNFLTELPRLPLNLDKLFCQNNNLTTLPELPPKLTTLVCTGNRLTSLPDLNNGLKLIDLNVNQLTSLPKLPKTLTHLYCNTNALTTLPELPDSLRIFTCWNNPFIAPFNAFVLDYNMSRNINRLKQDVNGYYAELKRKGRNLGSMMETLGRTEVQGRMGLGNNNTLRNVKANGTRKTLNKLPNGPLATIGSFLTGLPGSVNNQRNAAKRNFSAVNNLYGGKKRRNQKGGNLISLDYSNKGLRSLPELPYTLIELYCGNNQLITLPELPNIRDLYCNGNQLRVLPKLPETLELLICYSNQLRVLPELPASLISIIFKIGEHSNPFIEPFKSFTDEYERTDNILDLRNNVNSYWAEQKAKGRNLGSMMETLGRTEVQGRMGLGNANTPRNVNPNGTRKAANRIPMNALSLTGSFLTGLPGSVNNQRNALKGNFKGGKKPRRTRKN
jgi:hypothetical protein